MAEHSQIHLYHLNPCVQFWGQLQSDRQQARQLREQQLDDWLQDENRQDSNTLLANLGQQGKEFFNLLQKLLSAKDFPHKYKLRLNYVLKAHHLKHRLCSQLIRTKRVQLFCQLP